MQFGVTMFATDFSLSPAELARMVEGVGLDSLWLPEHTHMPLNHGQYPGGGPLPKTYSHSVDPFVGLAAAAAVTSTLKLGTGVCLVTEHDPIALAKQVASLDHLSNGRFLFGIGAGWNEPEMRNHGTNPRLRWRVLRERVLAMKAIWTQDEAEYHGDLVNFDKLWSWPKPIQKPHPPIMMGGDGPKATEGVVDYCDEWMPHPERTGRTLTERVNDLQARAAATGRPPLPVTAFGLDGDPKQIESCQAAGARSCVLRLPSSSADEVLPVVKRYGELVKSFR
jgi:probable F420-dependent oxidoreductase